MSGLRQPAVVVAGLGLGQIVAFACSFYLMGVLGDAIGRDLGLSGRVVLTDGTILLLQVDEPLLHIPQLAIHLDDGHPKTREQMLAAFLFEAPPIDPVAL